MTQIEITRAIVHYNNVIKSKSRGEFKYTFMERMFARLMKRYYTNKWEHYFDEDD